MLWMEQARLLLRKARQDVVVVARAVNDSVSAPGIEKPPKSL
jgi:ribosomal protein L31E